MIGKRCPLAKPGQSQLANQEVNSVCSLFLLLLVVVVVVVIAVVHSFGRHFGVLVFLFF